MPPEEFFRGKTHAGRELRLYYQHTAFETYDTEEGPYDNPTATEYTGAVDGVPIKVLGMTVSVRRSVTVQTDQGTFSAVADDSDEDHAEALGRHLEWRPSDGWEVTIVNKGQEPESSRYTVTITNGRLTEQTDFILSPQVMRTLARGADAPTDKQVTREIAQTVRSDKWAKIKERAEEPTTLMWLAHPS